MKAPCVHLGVFLETRKCKACPNKGHTFPVHRCAVYDLCSPQKLHVERVRKCSLCDEYQPRESNE